MKKCIICGEKAEFTIQKEGEKPLSYCGLHMLQYCLEFIEGWILVDIEQMLMRPVKCVCFKCGYPHIDWREVKGDKEVK